MLNQEQQERLDTFKQKENEYHNKLAETIRRKLLIHIHDEVKVNIMTSEIMDGITKVNFECISDIDFD